MPGILPPAERRSVVLVATYAALSLLLLLVGDRLPASWSRGAGAFLFAPFDRVVLTGDRLFAAWRENTALHERLAALEIENQRLRLEGSENRRLRDQLALPEWQGLPLKPVEVLAFSGDPVPTAVTLSAGTDGGVHAGDALLTRDGLVGRVVEAWPTLSRAALVTDPNMAISCEVETTGVNGILRVSLVPRPRLLFTAVPLADTVRKGERIVTSNLSLRFPRGIPIGRVVGIRSDASGLMQEVEVEPAAALSRLRQAFVTPGPPSIHTGELPRPHVEFEPVRVAAPPSKLTAATPRVVSPVRPDSAAGRPRGAASSGGAR